MMTDLLARDPQFGWLLIGLIFAGLLFVALLVDAVLAWVIQGPRHYV